MKDAVKFGLAAGIISGSSLFLEYHLGIIEGSKGVYSVLFTMLVLLVFIYISIFLADKKIYGNSITNQQGFKEGMIVATVAALVISIFTVVFNQTIMPEFMEIAINEGVAKMREQGMEEAEIDKAIASYRSMHAPLIEVAKALFKVLFTGAVFSFVITILIRKNPFKKN